MASSAFWACSRFSASSHAAELRPPQDVLRDLLAAVGGQAVQDDVIGRGAREQAGVHLVARQVAQPPVAVVLLAHARPRVGDDGVGALDRGDRVVDDLHHGCRRVDDVGIGRVAVGRRDDDLHPDHGGGGQKRMADVVQPVADPRQPPALEVAEPLAQHHQVGERLAGVVLVGEAVHDGHGRRLRRAPPPAECECVRIMIAST